MISVGTYEGQNVAGKVMFGKVTKEIMEDLMNEVRNLVLKCEILS